MVQNHLPKRHSQNRSWDRKVIQWTHFIPIHRGADSAKLHLVIDLGWRTVDTMIALTAFSPDSIQFLQVALADKDGTDRILMNAGDTQFAFLKMLSMVTPEVSLSEITTTLIYDDTLLTALQPIGLNGWTVTHEMIVGDSILVDLHRSSQQQINAGENMCEFPFIGYLSTPSRGLLLLDRVIYDSAIFPGCIVLSAGPLDSLQVALRWYCGYPTLLQFMKTGKISLAIESISPNPGSDWVTVHFANPTSSLISYQVFDALGMIRASGAASGDDLVLDTRSLASGLYYLRARNAMGAVAAGRFAVER